MYSAWPSFISKILGVLKTLWDSFWGQKQAKAPDDQGNRIENN